MSIAGREVQPLVAAFTSTWVGEICACRRDRFLLTPIPRRIPSYGMAETNVGLLATILALGSSRRIQESQDREHLGQPVPLRKYKSKRN